MFTSLLTDKQTGKKHYVSSQSRLVKA